MPKKRKPLRRIQPWERLPMHHAEQVGGDKEVAIIETPGGAFEIETRDHRYPLDAEEPDIHIEADKVFIINKAIAPSEIKRISSLEDAGIRGGIHSQHTWLVALYDGSLWIAKQTGTEERDEVFTYELARRMFRAIVPETTVTNLPKIGWVSMQRKVSGIPAGRVDGLHGYMHGNDEMQADLVAMMVLDYLIGNPDRHSNNWFLMHNDRLAAIDNGWAGEDPTMTLSAVFQPADLAGLVRDESLWPKMLQMMLTLVNDLTGRGDEARALAQEIDIDRKEAVAMVRLWEPKLAKLERFIRTEYAKIKQGALTKADRFWSKVEKTDGCWFWLASKTENGYGRFQDMLAHRWSYVQAGKTIPEGFDLDHTCHTPDCKAGNACPHRACVRPDHLEPVTRKENLRRGVNGAKTHCPVGHPYDKTNNYRDPNGKRRCKVCRREDMARRYAVKTEASKLEKARTYIETPEQAPAGARVETGPRGGLYYEGEPVFPGFERPPEHRAGAALLDDKTVDLASRQHDIFITALEEISEEPGFGHVAHLSMSDGKIRSAMKTRIANAIAARLEEAGMALPPGLDKTTYVSKMLSSWAASSSDDNDDSIAMQLAASELFDVRSTPYIAEHYRVEYFKEHEIGKAHLMRAKMVVQAMYDETQEFFKKHDIQELVLFRGMRWIDGAEPKEVQDVAYKSANTREIMPGLNTAEIALHANPLSSWSYEPGEAMTFANYKPDTEGTEYEGSGGYDLNDPGFQAEAEEALEREAEEAEVAREDYEGWKEEFLADKGYYDVGQWAYSYMDIEPPQIEPPAVRSVMVSRVPAHKILATAMTGLGCLAENEVVALGGDNFPTQIYAGRSPDEAEVGLPSFRDIVVAERDYAETQTPEAQEAERAKKEFSTWADANLSDLLQQRVDAVNQATAGVRGKVGPMAEQIDELKVQMNAAPTLDEYNEIWAKTERLARKRTAIIDQATNEAEEPFRVKAAQVIEEAGYEVPLGWRPRGQPDA